MEGRCVGADEGGVAGGCAKRRAAGRPHCVPLRGLVGRGLQLKSTGCCERGWKGASASEAVAEYSKVGRAKAGRLHGVVDAEAGHAKGKEPPGRRATSIIKAGSFIIFLGWGACVHPYFDFVSVLSPVNAGSV